MTTSTFKYRVYYPVLGQKELNHEDFVSSSKEEAKAAANDFASNFKREQVIIQLKNI